jgi:RNA polymerase sigma-70 factor (ECF subfamily)
LRYSCNHKTRQLVALAKEGDETALNQLCKFYGERVRWIVRLRMGEELRSKLESMDMVQDVLLSALKDLRDFRYQDEGDFLRWLSRIAENRLRDNVDKLHADKRDIRKEVRFDNYGPRTEGRSFGERGQVDSTTPSVIMSRKEELDELARAIEELKPDYKEVIVLTKIEGLSYKEISNRLGKSDEAVRKLFTRAMAALTTVFEND